MVNFCLCSVFHITIIIDNQTYFLSISFTNKTLVFHINQENYSTMRSFFIGLFFLLIISYWTHLFVTRELDPKDLVTIIIDNRPVGSGICECRCCLLSGTMCESFIRRSISFKKDFSCDLCTDNFCTMNTSQTEQCQWMYAMKADCFQYESRQKSSTSFVDLRPILQ
jgi:hypothetical protein